MNIIGFIAAFTTTIAFLPQTLKTIKDQQTDGVSLIMYLVFSLGVFLWIIYAILIGDLAILLANIFTLFFSIIVLFVKVKNVLYKGEKI
ncbi:MAG: hypothetical protein RIS53_98 [Bacillota bacterium]